MKKFKHLVYAGTFDRLHIGHKKLLSMAFELGEKVSIGITSEKLYKSKPLANLIQTWQVRRRAVEQYLGVRKWLKRVRFFRIDDIYGPSIVDKSMDSILVTELTRTNAEKINKRRSKKGLPALEIIVAPLVRGDGGEVMTSERIRMGEIDRNGNSYLLIVNSYLKRGKKELILPKYLREELRKPIGRVFGGSVDQLSATAKKVIKFIKFIKPTMVISVGDIVTISLLEVGFVPQVSIIDLKSRRKPIQEERILKLLPTRHGREELVTIEVKNDAGTVNLQAVRKIQKAIKQTIFKNLKFLLKVRGEEDLLALPAILLAPLQSIVLYGQMDLGVVMVEVTEEKKRVVKEIIKKFK